MTDEKGNTPQDRRTVALSEDHERRHFIEQYVKGHPGTTKEQVEGVLDTASSAIGPSESREKLTEAVERALKDV